MTKKMKVMWFWIEEKAPSFFWQTLFPEKEVLPISSIKNDNLIFQCNQKYALPVGWLYYKMWKFCGNVEGGEDDMWSFNLKQGQGALIPLAGCCTKIWSLLQFRAKEYDNCNFKLKWECALPVSWPLPKIHVYGNFFDKIDARIKCVTLQPLESDFKFVFKLGS